MRKDPLQKYETMLGGKVIEVLRRMQSDGRLRDSTVDVYARLLREFHDHTGAAFFGVDSSDVASYYQSLRERKIRASTIRKNIACLHSVVEYVISHRNELEIGDTVFASNPFTPYLPQDESDDVDFRNVAKPEDVRRLLSAFSAEDPLTLITCLSTKLMLTSEELFHLTCADIFNTTFEGKYVMALRVGKDVTQRSLIIPSDMETILWDAKKRAFAATASESAYLIAPDQTDRERVKRTLSMRLHRTVKKLALPERFGLNSLRNLGIALCSASDDELREHLAYLDVRHDRRFAVLRELGDRVSNAADKVRLEIVYRTVPDAPAPKKRAKRAASIAP